MSGVDIDDFAENFEGALDTLTQETIARVERETAGMTELQVAEYWLKSATSHLEKMRTLNAPEFLIEMAEQRVAKNEARCDAIRRK